MMELCTLFILRRGNHGPCRLHTHDSGYSVQSRLWRWSKGCVTTVCRTVLSGALLPLFPSILGAGASVEPTSELFRLMANHESLAGLGCC